MLHASPVRGSDSHPLLLADDRPVVRRRYRSVALRTLEIDGGRWRSQRDFYDALSDLLGGVERTCRSSRALLETMIYYPDLNAVRPPYEIVITSSSAELRPFLVDFACGVAEARLDR